MINCNLRIVDMQSAAARRHGTYCRYTPSSFVLCCLRSPHHTIEILISSYTHRSHINKIHERTRTLLLLKISSPARREICARRMRRAYGKYIHKCISSGVYGKQFLIYFFYFIIVDVRDDIRRATRTRATPKTTLIWCGAALPLHTTRWRSASTHECGADKNFFLFWVVGVNVKYTQCETIWQQNI